MLAYVDLHIADAFAIKGIRILKKPNAPPFVVFPAAREGTKWADIAHPLNMEARGACLQLILYEYERTQK